MRLAPGFLGWTEDLSRCRKFVESFFEEFRGYPLRRVDNGDTWAQCYKNTTVNYRGNFNPNFYKVKMTLKNDSGLKILW